MPKGKKNFAITIKLTPEQVSDLLCMALEGGSNYWYQIEKVIKPTSWEFDSEPRGNDHWLHDYPINPDGALMISDGDQDHGLMRLDKNALQKGLMVMTEKYPWHIMNLINENADADTGDVFLQCCLFGDMIYS